MADGAGDVVPVGVREILDGAILEPAPPSSMIRSAVAEIREVNNYDSLHRDRSLPWHR